MWGGVEGNGQVGKEGCPVLLEFNIALRERKAKARKEATV